MSRFISCVLFVAVLLAVCLYPHAETAADMIVNPAATARVTQTLEGDSGAQGFSSEGVPPVMVTPSPEPTPSPTPTPAPTPEPIVKGEVGDDVWRLQTLLTQLGFMSGAVDGEYGNATESAVKEAKKYLNAVEGARGGDGAVPVSAMRFSEDGAAAGHDLMEDLEAGTSFPIQKTVMQKGDSGLDAYRLQRRLTNLNYLYKGIDGVIGNLTVEAIQNFQRVNGLNQTGVADLQTLQMLYSGDALESDKPLHPYKLIVDVSDQRVHVYQWNESSQDYDKKVQQFKCSTGTKKTPTPLGTYQASTGPAARWHYFKQFNSWAQYAYSIEGDVLFHSVLFSQKNENTVSKSSVRNLGKRASHGCVRLSVDDAKWIWSNCPNGTTVVIQN